MSFPFIRMTRSPSLSAASASVLVAVFSLCGSRLPAQACDGSLSLAETASQPLPPTFGIDGVSPAPDGRLVVWSAEGEILLIARPGTLDRLVLPDSIRPAGLAVVAGGYRVLDRASGRDYLLGEHPGDQVALLGSVPLGPGQHLDQAMWHQWSWVLGVRDGPSRRFLVSRTRDPAPLFVSPPGADSKDVPRFHLSPDGPDILLTRLTAPFEIVRVSAPGADSMPFRVRFGTSGLPAVAPDSVGSWRALPALALDCGVLLTLSNLTNDRRLLIRFDRSGIVRRVTELDAPIGLVTRLPGTERLLAARRAGDLELVWYDWRWVREPRGSN